MLNHIVVMGRLTRDPELRKTASGVSVTSFSVAVDRDFSQDGQENPFPSVDRRKRIFLMSLHGETQLNLRQSILRKAVWQSCPVACRSGTGRIKTATSAARQKFLPKTSILATAKRRTTALLHPHPHKASRPALAAHSPAALCRTLVEDIKRTSCLCRCFDCINFGMLVK